MTPAALPPVLIPAEALACRVAALGDDLTVRLRGSTAPLMLVLMDGAFVFAADLARAVHRPDLELRFVRASSYHGRTTSSGTVSLEPMPDLHGRMVVLVDDILDTGRTLAVTKRAAHAACASTVLTCVLLDKPARRQPDGLAQADMVGFTIPDRFVVGYGLDQDGRFRQLPYIGTC
jgi:hypoxanthine phosphoribosyltransferase